MTSDPKKDDDAKSNQTMMGAGIAIGAGMGIALGSAMDNVGAGLAIGMAVGIAIGSGMQRKKNSK